MKNNTCPPRRLRFIKVEFAPSSGCLGSLVALVTDFCRNVIDDPDIIFAFRMATFELSENIVKYCSGDRAWLEVSVDNGADGSALVLTTSNQAQLDRLADVSERLAAAENANDPVAHFDDLVRETLNSPNESRLGIGRLRAEADLELTHHTNGDWITITARRRILKIGAGGN
jgi:hypothetical protein